MKKTVAALAMLALMPLSSFAISLAELQSDPARYVKTEDSPNATYYVDVTTIQSLKYAPPYYTLRATSYCVSPTLSMLFEEDLIIDYDHQRSWFPLKEQVAALHPDWDEDRCFDEFLEEIQRDGGVSTTSQYVHFYELDGTLIEKRGKQATRKMPFDTLGFEVANIIFERCYGERFSY